MKYLGLLVGDKDYLNNVVPALTSCRLSSAVALLFMCDEKDPAQRDTSVLLLGRNREEREFFLLLLILKLTFN